MTTMRQEAGRGQGCPLPYFFPFPTSSFLPPLLLLSFLFSSPSPLLFLSFLCLYFSFHLYSYLTYTITKKMLLLNIIYKVLIYNWLHGMWEHSKVLGSYALFTVVIRFLIWHARRRYIVRWRIQWQCHCGNNQFGARLCLNCWPRKKSRVCTRLDAIWLVPSLSREESQDCKVSWDDGFGEVKDSLRMDTAGWSFEDMEKKEKVVLKPRLPSFYQPMALAHCSVCQHDWS